MLLSNNLKQKLSPLIFVPGILIAGMSGKFMFDRIKNSYNTDMCEKLREQIKKCSKYSKTVENDNKCKKLIEQYDKYCYYHLNENYFQFFDYR